MRVILGCTGSVASIKVPELAELLVARGAEVRVVATEASLRFFDAAATLPARCPLLRDADEWQPRWTRVGDPVLHIDLREWADVLLLAPLSANTLAKISCGVADNLLTSVARAWNWRCPAKRAVLAPAMNTQMYEHPLTARQLAEICSWAPPERAVLVPPVSKMLACGELGQGALAPVGAIVDAVFSSPQPRL